MWECITALFFSLFLLLASCSSNLIFNQNLLAFVDFHSGNSEFSRSLQSTLQDGDYKRPAARLDLANSGWSYARPVRLVQSIQLGGSLLLQHPAVPLTHCDPGDALAGRLAASKQAGAAHVLGLRAGRRIRFCGIQVPHV